MRYRIKDPDERQGLKLLGLPVEFKEEDIIDRHTSYYFYGDQRDCVYLDFFSEFEIEPVEESPAVRAFNDTARKIAEMPVWEPPADPPEDPGEASRLSVESHIEWCKHNQEKQQ